MIYFDNAATSFPKPKIVLDRVVNSIKNHGNAGRSGYPVSLDAAKSIFQARLSTADFFGSISPERVIFTQNATMSLNIAIKCFVKPNSHIITSCFEHNSVLRPLCNLNSNKIVEFDVSDIDLEDDEKTVANTIKLLKENTSMIVLTHVSNVCGKILPVKKIISEVRKIRNDIIFVLDAAQSAGSLKINVQEMGVDILCVPSHKGLMGITGAGILLFSDNFDVEKFNSAPLIHGGTGINSLDMDMPDDFPERFEGGTLNTPSIVGIAAGIEYIHSVGLEEIYFHEQSLYDKAIEMLSDFAKKNIIVYSKPSKYNYTGCILFNVKNKNNEIAEMASKTLIDNNICVRSGYHCAPLSHKKLNTMEKGGIRISFGYNNNIKELNMFYKILKQF